MSAKTERFANTPLINFAAPRQLSFAMHSKSKPNFTAWFVMQGFIAAMHHPDFRDGADDVTLELYRPLADAASKTRLISRIIHSLPYSWQYRIGEMVTNAGRLRHFCFRKKEIEKHARQLLEQGSIKQVIILGAGLDVLSLRLAQEYPAVKFIEIDTKESQGFKVSSLKAGRAPMSGNVEFIEGDLRDPLPSILAYSKFHDPMAQTLWVAEGFFMFVPEDSVIRIFKEMRQNSAVGSCIIFTTIPAKKIASAIGHAIQTLYLKKENSSFHWAMPFDKVPIFIRNLGYEIISQIQCDALHKHYMGEKFNSNHNFAEDIHIAINRNV